MTIPRCTVPRDSCNTPVNQDARRSSSVCEPPSESLHNNPPRQLTVGRTGSVDETELESPSNPPDEQQQLAGYTRSVSAAQFVSLLHPNRTRTNPTKGYNEAVGTGFKPMSSIKPPE
ncbi:hypothetical protein PR001_g7882 [Phytophthora rubi]|uniref:Uncharacterized protein n=1 Tax=Phytophthora rubi TaxID=129364 RepID=A0A6A3LCH6_9STRA|nr:hypothetical protein PR002_g13758 [Phytophthora rubi]KAE9038620.1 hypothetical protein PR001_g7882 [Phytophthora rubi]